MDPRTHGTDWHQSGTRQTNLRVAVLTVAAVVTAALCALLASAGVPW